MIQFECTRVIHPLLSFTLGIHYGEPFPSMLENGMMHAACDRSGNVFCKNRFCGVQMVQFECTKVIHSLLTLALGIHYGVLFTLRAGNWNSVFSLLKKWKFILQK